MNFSISLMNFSIFSKDFLLLSNFLLISCLNIFLSSSQNLISLAFCIEIIMTIFAFVLDLEDSKRIVLFYFRFSVILEIKFSLVCPETIFLLLKSLINVLKFCGQSEQFDFSFFIDFLNCDNKDHRNQ